MIITNNMNNQDVLLQQLRKQLAANESINDAIASILNISYDAAHRRVSGKSKFSIDETIQLADHYNISLDDLFFQKGKIIIEKTIEITTLREMQQYFSNAAAQIELLTRNQSVRLYYSAKDIPLFYFMDATILSKFKAYVWLNLLNPNASNMAFEDFVIDASFMEPMEKLKKAYEKVEVNEIWNDTTINSSLQQVLYFYEAGLLQYKSAIALFNDLKRIVNLTREKCNKEQSNFTIYYNELILLNNNLLIESEEQLTLFVPYTLLGYFITDNEDSCKNVHQFFKQQIRSSKTLNQTGIKDQNLFFNKAIRKIDYYIDQLNNQVDLMF